MSYIWGEKKVADLYNCIFPTLIGNKQRVINQQFKQGVREHWAVYYTSPKSLIIMFSYLLALQLWGLLLNLIGWLSKHECPDVSTTALIVI